MAYLTLLIPAMALAGVLLVERLECWALLAPEARGDPVEPAHATVTAAGPDRQRST